MNKILIRSLLLAAVVISGSRAADGCGMTFTTCPESFNNDTIDVPASVTGLSPNVFACNGNDYTESFFFILDNSGSMQGNSGSDPTAARFSVTSALLDTIFAKQPQAQVGLAVIQELLYFNASSSNYWFSRYFKTMSVVYDSQPNQAYVPFLTLNRLYDGLRGIDILDSILQTTGTGGNTTLRYLPNYTPALAGRTNINIGFLAARDAFANATTPKNQHYIIFLSDGEANQGQHDPGADSLWYWRDSTRNVPTTFTVFFSANGVPASIQSMTQNIANNGYSSSNPSSASYSVSASFISLMNVLMTNVFSKIDGTSLPVKMVLNAIESDTYANGSFMFPSPFFLRPNDVSPYSMVITYQNTDMLTNTTSIIVDTTAFFVRQSATSSTPPGIGINCYQNTRQSMTAGAIAAPKVSAVHSRGQNRTCIRYILPGGFSGTTISLEIYCLKGALVRRISDKATGTLSTLSWDERDASNIQVQPGMYIIRLTSGAINLDSRFVIMR